jgi:peptidyl-prolyl cis-trans isomerase C
MSNYLRCSGVLAALFVLAAGCAEGARPTAEAGVCESARPPAAPKDLLVTVNGAPIGAAEIEAKLKADSHESEVTPERTKNVLEGLIRQELMYQRAVELGLTSDAKYQEAVRQMEAQLHALKRKELSEVFLRQEVEKKAAVTDEDARKYFDQNAARLRTELHVLQILARTEAAIDKVHEELGKGDSFEDVAARRFPGMTGAKPWDLGYLNWQKVPEAWRGVVYGMKAGDVSVVIRGAKDRYWVLKVVDKRENADVSFDKVRDGIVVEMKRAKSDEVRDKLEADLRAKAKIVFAPGAMTSGGATNPTQSTE